jgi:hypothetical protein
MPAAKLNRRLNAKKPRCTGASTGEIIPEITAFLRSFWGIGIFVLPPGVMTAGFNGIITLPPHADCEKAKLYEAAGNT